MEGEEIVKKNKAKRTRGKLLCTTLRKQFEFYFSDSNLQKSLFMTNLIEKSENGFVELGVIADFNIIKKLTTNVELIRKSLSTSSKLEFNEDKTRIRRITDIVMPTNTDERTIYIEGILLTDDHRSLDRHFNKYGDITYISIPRYRGTKDNKGFAFIEFSSVKSVSLICKEYKIDLSKQKMGMFPMISKYQKQLAKLIYNKGYEMPNCSSKCTSVQSSPDITLSVAATSTTDDLAAIDEEEDDPMTSNLTVAGTAATTDNVMTSSEKGAVRNLKRKATANADNVISLKRKAQPDTDTNADVKTSSGQLKRKAPDVEGECDAAKVTNTLTDKHSRLTVQPSGQTAFRIITKIQWMVLRHNYLSEQKHNITEMQKKLRQIRCERGTQYASIAPKEDTEIDHHTTVAPIVKQDPPKKAPPSFVADTILSYKTSSSLQRSQVRLKFEVLVADEDTADHAGEGGDAEQDKKISTPLISYIDMMDGDHCCIVRCRDAAVATRILQAYQPENDDETLSLLKDKEENDYWLKLAEDREKRLLVKSRSKNRNQKTKLLKKAEKILVTKILKHKHFDD